MQENAFMVGVTTKNNRIVQISIPSHEPSIKKTVQKLNIIFVRLTMA